MYSIWDTGMFRYILEIFNLSVSDSLSLSRKTIVNLAEKDLRYTLDRVSGGKPFIYKFRVIPLTRYVLFYYISVQKQWYHKNVILHDSKITYDPCVSALLQISPYLKLLPNPIQIEHPNI